MLFFFLNVECCVVCRYEIDLEVYVMVLVNDEKNLNFCKNMYF